MVQPLRRQLLALVLVAGPPRGELAGPVAVLALPAPGAQVQALGRGGGPAVSAPIRVGAHIGGGVVVEWLDRSFAV